MLGLSFPQYNYIFFIIFIFLDFTLNFCIFKFFIFNKHWVKQNTKKFNFIFFKAPNIRLILFLLVINIITLKASKFASAQLLFGYYFFLLMILILSFSIVSSLVEKLQFNPFIILFFICFSFLLLFVKSLITLLFILELYGLIYYFFFIERFRFNKFLTLVKFKNLLALYLWNSFLTSLFFGFGCYLVSCKTGTLCFNELEFFRQEPGTGVYLIFFSICWKLGIPGFHFYKIQLYRFLEKSNLFLFSILSIIFNIVLFQFLLYQPIFFNCLSLYCFSNYFFFFIIFIIFYYIKINSFQNFIAFSSLVTVNYILIGILN